MGGFGRDCYICSRITKFRHFLVMYLLGYDVGSSSVKAAIVNAQTGECVASDFYPKSEAPIKAHKAGWAEQSPENWWQYLKEATHAVMRQLAHLPYW